MDSKKIGSFIYELRKNKKLSQMELAKMIPISREAVSKWERGETIPSSETLLRLSDIFNVSVDNILLGEVVIENKEEKLQNFALEMIDENNIKKKKIHTMKILIVLLFIISIVMFLFYYFCITYNSVKVYTVSGNSESFFMADGLFVVTKEKIFFKLGDFEFSDEIEVKNVEMYYLKDGKEIMMITKDGFFGLIRDYYGYNAYFNLEELDTILNNTYLRIEYSDRQEDMKLKFTQSYANDRLFFLKRPEISITLDEDTDASKNENISEEAKNIIENIHNKFECQDQVCALQIQEGNVLTEFSYFDVGGHLNVSEKNGNLRTQWIYYVNSNFLCYRLYLDEKLINSRELYLDLVKVTNQDYKYYLEFKEKYILKYLS